MLAALFFAFLASLFGGFVKKRFETGSILMSPTPGVGSGKTTREKHPILFWLWNAQFIGATLMLTGLAISSFTDAIGFTHIADSIQVQNAPD